MTTDDNSKGPITKCGKLTDRRCATLQDFSGWITEAIELLQEYLDLTPYLRPSSWDSQIFAPVSYRAHELATEFFRRDVSDRFNPYTHGERAHLFSCCRVLQNLRELLELAQTRESPDEQDIYALDDEDILILRALAKNRALMVQVDIEANSGVTRKTISKRIPKLLNAKLVEQPGKKAGIVITNQGLKALSRLPSQ
jgi:hypothetical protein